MCPHCGKNAPIVHRGLAAYCTACGRERLPLAGTSVDLAGKPSRVGGVVAGVLGWLVLIGGTAVALLLGLIAAALFPGSIAGLAVGLPIGFIAVALGVLLLVSGRKLSRSGEKASRDAQARAIFSLASHRRRPLTAQEVGAALDLPAPEADALLTELAKERPDEVGVEIGERGEILYTFPRISGQTGVRFPRPSLRIDPRDGASVPAARLDDDEELEEAGVSRPSPRREHLR
ncbi:hypothetical protein SOCEGT47_022740 [Sorangium cellulosum]|uniref:Uncharacterized protein n=1 Tax=Sorangium cellulosum TaxID=56 RepID=A0A4P2PYW4_SORCE|nr:hypothetical protein [Sorangium cellulosum]AUX21786.1 hypothetical protein SOCEGT47_022740 [Sorangium cellulosum]